MQVSLRRAAQLRSDLEKLIAEKAAPPAKMSIYETDVPTAVATRRTEMLE